MNPNPTVGELIHILSEVLKDYDRGVWSGTSESAKYAREFVTMWNRENPPKAEPS